MVTATTMKAAWAVVLTSTNDYIKGVIALKHALHNLYRSQYPLLVLYTDAVDPEAVELLERVGCVLKEIDAIRPKGKVEYKSERFIDTWTKLAVWDQTEYDRLVMLDADMLPVQNMDELMVLNLPNKTWIAAAHACVCNPQRISHYPSTWVPENCAYTNTTTFACFHGESDNNKLNYFNSGLIVLTPDTQNFNRMVNYLNSIPDLNIYPFPDQDFLNEIFDNKWIQLPFVYNALKTLQWCHKPMWDMQYIKNVHYILTKPWDIDLNQETSELESIYKPLYEVWWSSYNQVLKQVGIRDEIDHAVSLKLSRH